MATFLWRLAGESSGALGVFADVPDNAFFAEAVGWMAENEIDQAIDLLRRISSSRARITFIWRRLVGHHNAWTAVDVPRRQCSRTSNARYRPTAPVRWASHLLADVAHGDSYRCWVAALRVLVCGWSGAGNIGDELLTGVIVARLRSAGLDPVVRSVSPDATVAAHGELAVAGRGLASLRTALAVDAVVLGPGGIDQVTPACGIGAAHLLPALIARRLTPPGPRRVSVSVRIHSAATLKRLLRALAGAHQVIVRDEFTGRCDA